MFIVDILVRWAHVISAIALIGGALFLHLVLPAGLKLVVDPEQSANAMQRCRRAFKLIAHPAILLVILSGTYNAWRNWKWYVVDPKSIHPFLGMHLLLALAVIVLSFMALAGRQPRPKLMKVNVILMVLAVAAASGLKWSRDKTVANQAGTPIKLPR